MHLDFEARTGARKAVTLMWTRAAGGQAFARPSGQGGTQASSRGSATHDMVAEEDCLWDARIAERWLGAYEGEVEDGEEWDLVAILGQVEGGWFAATMLVDGEGAPRQVGVRRNLPSKWAALRAFRQWR